MRTRITRAPAPIARSEVIVRWLPTDADVARLKAATSLPWFSPLVDLLDATGLRIGEVVGTRATYTTSDGTTRQTDRRGLVMADVLDGDSTSWTVRREVRIVGKGDKARTVPLSSAAQAAVAELVTLTGTVHARALLVPLARTYVATVFQQTSLRAGFDRTFNAHSLRARFVTRLVNDHKVREAMMISGHSSVETTIGTYTRPSSEDLHRAVATPPPRVQINAF